MRMSADRGNDQVHHKVVNMNFEQEHADTHNGESEVSCLVVDDLLFKIRRQASLAIWEAVQTKLGRISFDKVHSLKEEVDKVLDVV